MSDLLSKFRQVELLNEGDPHDPDYWLKFTDPDGVRSGKSGYSFGVCQFDVLNNSMAILCLKECGFTDQEISYLKLQPIGLDLAPLEAKLRAHQDVIIRYDESQLTGCVSRAKKMSIILPVHAVNDAAILALADYDNQYGLSFIDKPGYLMHYLANLSGSFSAKDILYFKLNFTKYGKEHPADCERRYNNLIKVMSAT